VSEKKSFVLYADSLDVVEMLTDEQAGILFKAIMRYKSGLDLPDMDGMTKVAFVAIKTYLDRDAERYEQICEKRREAGKKGGILKGIKNADKQMHSEESESKQIKQMLPSASKSSKCYQVKANQADSDNDIDNDNDSENESDSDLNKTSCTEPATVSMPEPVVISLPLNDGSLWPVTQSYADQLKTLYPAVDVDQELRKMYGWLDSKQSNRKTKRGIKAFITNWLSKSQDKARSYAPVRGNTYQTRNQRVDSDLVDWCRAVEGR